MQIIEDYRFYRAAKSELDKAENALNVYRDSITQECDGKVFSNNVYKSDMFYKSLKMFYDSISHTNEKGVFHNIYKNYTACIPSSCFYTLRPGQMITCMPSKIERKADLHGVFSCVNADDTTINVYCLDCSHLADIAKYKSLHSDFNEAKQKFAYAKQKLLDDLMFWKQH